MPVDQSLMPEENLRRPPGENLCHNAEVLARRRAEPKTLFLPTTVLGLLANCGVLSAFCGPSTSAYVKTQIIKILKQSQ